MSKKERVKTKLDLLKVLIVAVLTALFSVASFAALYYDEIATNKLLLAIIGIVVLFLGLVYLLYSFGKELNKLEKL